ncbi:family 31 carbohydrate-binding protein [Aliagarivorans taiwanensis]|uniref:family 31 carbohydrate-binding protein n=1 Tax=Aliagarivorans taiwanensis TaxID=561966 RepID=UPI0003FF3E2B|nr:family 31 carbohydrate-binding protein [Aliagarivorans taiwanensis]
MKRRSLSVISLACGLALSAGLTAAPLVPEQGRLFSVGQDVDSINDFHNETSIAAGGVTGYVGIAALDGLHGDADAGAGRNNLDQLASLYPDRAIIAGISMNGQVDAVAAGTYNNNITNLLESLYGYDRPVYLRWAYEVDGPWNGHNQADLITSWRYVYNRIRELGFEDRIAMVWQVSSYCPNPRGQLESWYPGNAYVDWIGLSYFAPQDCNWDAVNEAADFAKAKGKPIFINESSPQRYQIADLNYSADPAQGTNRQSKTGQQIWDEWFAPFFNFIDRYDVKAITYINADWDNQWRWGDFGDGYGEGYWGDSRVQANSLIEENFTAEVSDGVWLLQNEQLFAQLGYGSSQPPVDPPVDPPIDPPIEPQGDLGFSYIDADTIEVFHRDQGWSASWQYVCLDGFCLPGSLEGGYYKKRFDGVVVGQSYTIQFKAQDNSSGQFISEEKVITFAEGGTDPVDPPVEPPIEPPIDPPIDPPTNPGEYPDFGLVAVDGSTFKAVRKDQGWTANFVYLCNGADCRTPNLVDGYYEYQWPGVAGNEYQLTFKVQDNALGQVIEETSAVFNP